MTTLSAWIPGDAPDQTGRTAIITGANSGLGLAAAQVLAGHGGRVIMACRDAEKAAAAEQLVHDHHGGRADVEVRALDLADLSSIESFAEGIVTSESHLDLLVNNAGVMMCPKETTVDGFERQFGTNHLGHFALVGRLHELMSQRPGARIVTVSSLMAQRGSIDFDDLMGDESYSKSGAYAQSKLANLVFAFELQRRLDAAGSTTLSVAAHPGYTRTNLQRHSVWARIGNPLLAQKPEVGVLPMLYAAVGDGVEGGDYYGPAGIGEMRGGPAHAKKPSAATGLDTARRLWEASEELTGVRYLDEDA